MSRNRIAARIRKNDDFDVVSGILDDLKQRGVDITYSVHLPAGKGAHPRVIVTCEGKEAEFVVACTPSSINRGAVRREFEKFLRKAFT